MGQTETRLGEVLPDGCPDACGIEHGVGNAEDKAMRHAIEMATENSHCLCDGEDGHKLWCPLSPSRLERVPLCACGYSHKALGVGYYSAEGYFCKRCGQLHTRHDGKPSQSRPEAELVRRFDEVLVGRRPSTCLTAEEIEHGAKTH